MNDVDRLVENFVLLIAIIGPCSNLDFIDPNASIVVLFRPGVAIKIPKSVSAMSLIFFLSLSLYGIIFSIII